MASIPCLDSEPDLVAGDTGAWAHVLEALGIWNRAFSPGDPVAFERRLAWDGLDRDGALALASDCASDRHTTRVVWADWLDALAHQAARQPADPAHDDALAHVPFAELWAAMVAVARRALVRFRPTAGRELGPAAWSAFERQLAKELALIGELALHREFSAFRDASPTPDVASSGDASERYRAFVRVTLDDGFVSVLRKYPVLARHIVIVLEDWIDGLRELLERVERDRAGIAARFADGRNPGVIVGAEPGLSDPHHRRRRVAIVVFESGLRLVYKPRTIRSECVLNSWLAWLAARGLRPAPRIVRVLDRDDYGWVECVEQGAFTHRGDVHEYYRRAGGLACLAYVLRGRDLHWENIVATSGGPVIVDAELLVHPARADEPEASCLTTGLLTLLHTSPDGETSDIGGLSGDRVGAGPVAERVWEGLGTDGLTFTERRNPIAAKKNRVVVDGIVQQPADFVDDMLAGFEDAYRVIAAARDQILAPGGPLAWFGRCRARILFRPSDQYASALYALADPKYQVDGVRWGGALDALNRRFQYSTTRPREWPMVAAERVALERLDIPYFSVGCGETSVSGDGQVLIDDCFDRSGIDAVASLLGQLDEEGLQRQRRIMRRALQQSIRSRFSTPLVLPAVTGGQDYRAIILQAASWIGDELLARAERDGGLRWRYAIDGARDEVAEHRLYDGTCGMALFLAALGAVSGDPRWRSAAQLAYYPIARVTRMDSGASVSTGVTSGLGSIIYSMTMIGVLLDDASAIRLAVDLADRLTPALVDADPAVDVSDGCAGAALALMALHAVAPNRELMARAIYCGRRLVSSQVGASVGAAWRSRDDVLLAGFAHGAAGIAYALMRLYQQTGDTSFRQAAARAHDYERSVFSTAARNWPVMSAASQRAGSSLMAAWCHGAPGIALARALGRDQVDDPAIDGEIAVGLETTARLGFAQADHLCCGNLGRAEVLLTAGRRVGSAEAVGAAMKIAGGVVRQAITRGHFRLSSTGFEYEVFNPGFFKGLSGIGYALLRMASPARLPSVLGFVAPSLEVPMPAAAAPVPRS